MSKKKNTFSEQLGKAIEASGQTRYAIHKATGLSQSMLSRLVSGDGWIGREAMNKLSGHLGLEITIRKARRSK
jgi:transcriptional regulator with XRE-family HTH domain